MKNKRLVKTIFLSVNDYEPVCNCHCMQDSIFSIDETRKDYSDVFNLLDQINVGPRTSLVNRIIDYARNTEE